MCWPNGVSWVVGVGVEFQFRGRPGPLGFHIAREAFIQLPAAGQLTACWDDCTTFRIAPSMSKWTIRIPDEEVGGVGLGRCCDRVAVQQSNTDWSGERARSVYVIYVKLIRANLRLESTYSISTGLLVSVNCVQLCCCLISKFIHIIVTPVVTCALAPPNDPHTSARGIQIVATQGTTSVHEASHCRWGQLSQHGRVRIPCAWQNKRGKRVALMNDAPLLSC